jgi:hypothetical protein
MNPKEALPYKRRLRGRARVANGRYVGGAKTLRAKPCAGGIVEAHESTRSLQLARAIRAVSVVKCACENTDWV